ncbi:MAG: hypothetical protein Pars2KO_06900 [Parasphingorhabdus sp.]
MRYFILLLSTALLSITGTAEAMERKLSTYGFESILITGNVNVSIETGRGSSAVAEAETWRALDRISLRKAGDELVVSVRERTNQTNRYSSELPISLRLTTNKLTKIVHRGSGNVTVDSLEGSNASARIGGFGSMTIGSVETDRLEISMNGGGEMTIGGAARTAKISLLGSSKLDASDLVVDDLDLSHRGPANTQISVERRAEISNSGTGFIRIGGQPDCLVRSVGSAEIICNPKS